MPANLYEPTDIKGFSVTASDYMAGATDVTYYFKVIPRQRVAKGAYIIVNLPSELKVEDTNKLTRACHRYQEGWFNGFAYNYIQCRYDSDKNTITVRNGFKTDSSAADPPILQWAIPGMTNPRAVMTTGTFNVTIYDESNKVLYFWNLTGTPTVTMSEFRTPDSINYTRSTEVNGQMSNYSWRIVASNYLTEGDQFVFTLPHPIVFSPNSTMIGQSYWLKGEQPCVISGAQDMITMTVTISSN